MLFPPQVRQEEKFVTYKNFNAQYDDEDDDNEDDQLNNEGSVNFRKKKIHHLHVQCA